MYESPADPAQAVLDDRVLIYPEPHANRTVVIVRAPAAGDWRVEAIDGGPISLETASPLPAVKVTGRVSGSGRGRVLRWSATAPTGQQLVFVERGDGVARRLATTTGRGGTLRFRPTLMSRRARRVEAQVVQDGLPRATVTVARFKAPAPSRAKKPRKLRAKSRRGTLDVRFASRGAKRWLVTLRGGGETLNVLATKRKLRLRALGWRPRSVSVAAMGSDGRRSRRATAKVR